MATVTRQHRELACAALHGYVPEDGSWLRGWCLTGQDGHAASWQWRQLNATAQAIADAEARGYARCQADVVTYLPAGIYRGAIERGEHVGAAQSDAGKKEV